MSNAAVAWSMDVQNTGPLSAEARLVLIALADHMDQDGRNAWPSVQRLADRLGVSPRAVQRSLKTLTENGVIVLGNQRIVAHVRGDRRPKVYDLGNPRPDGNVTPSRPDRNVTPSRPDRNVTPSRPDRNVTPSRPDRNVTPQPVDNPSRGDVGGSHGVTEASPKPKTELNPLTHLGIEGDPSAREATATPHDAGRIRVSTSAARRFGICAECGSSAAACLNRPGQCCPDCTGIQTHRPLGRAVSDDCPACGQRIGRSHVCHASALTTPRTGPPPGWREQIKPGQEVPSPSPLASQPGEPLDLGDLP